MKQKLTYLIPLACVIFFGGVLSLLLGLSYFATILLFLVVPSIYLSFLAPSAIKKASIFSLAIIGIPLVIDGLLVVNNTWFVETIFSYKIMGILPLEDIVFSFFSIYLVALLYEYLWGSHKTRSAWPPRMYILALISLLLIVAFTLLFFLAPQALLMPYSYFWVLFIAGSIPSIIALFRHPRLILRLSVMVALCFPFAMFYEIIALRNKVWGFQGDEYLALISFLGFEFPLEEFIFFLLLFPVGILAYYTLFDNKKILLEP